MNDITMDTYQARSRTTAIYPGANKAFDPTAIYYNALALAGEAGEIAGKVSKLIRDSGDLDGAFMDDLAAECGDVLWHLTQLVTDMEFDLSTVAGMNLHKLRSRAERGVLAGSGDNR